MRHSISLLDTFVACILAGAMCGIGCSSTTTSAPSGPTSHSLKQGDTLIYHAHRTDTTGTTVAGSDSTMTSTVLAITASYLGMNNVALVRLGADTAFYAPGSDSTFSLLQHSDSLGFGVVIPAVWLRYDPSKNGTKELDTTVTAVVNSVHDTGRVTTTVTYLGRGSATIGSTTVNTYKYSRTLTIVATYGKKTFTTTRTFTHEFAPIVGFFTSRTEVVSSDAPAAVQGTTYLQLTSYAFH